MHSCFICSSRLLWSCSSSSRPYSLKCQYNHTWTKICNDHQPHLVNLLYNFITAHKQSLGQGNIFIGVCQEFCSQGACLVLGGVQGPGGAWSRGGAWSGGVCLVWGVPGTGGVHGPRRGAWWRPPGWLLLRVVCILLECILVTIKNLKNFIAFTDASFER